MDQFRMRDEARILLKIPNSHTALGIYERILESIDLPEDRDKFCIIFLKEAVDQDRSFVIRKLIESGISIETDPLHDICYDIFFGGCLGVRRYRMCELLLKGGMSERLAHRDATRSMAVIIRHANTVEGMQWLVDHGIRFDALLLSYIEAPPMRQDVIRFIVAHVSPETRKNMTDSHALAYIEASDPDAVREFVMQHRDPRLIFKATKPDLDRNPIVRMHPLLTEHIINSGLHMTNGVYSAPVMFIYAVIATGKTRLVGKVLDHGADLLSDWCGVNTLVFATSVSVDMVRFLRSRGAKAVTYVRSALPADTSDDEDSDEDEEGDVSSEPDYEPATAMCRVFAVYGANANREAVQFLRESGGGLSSDTEISPTESEIVLKSILDTGTYEACDDMLRFVISAKIGFHIYSDSMHVIEMLLKSGGAVYCRSMAKVCVNNGIPIDITTRGDLTTIGMALAYEEYDCADLLWDEFGVRALPPLPGLQFGTLSGERVGAVSWLIRRKLWVDKPGESAAFADDTCLSTAVETGNCELVEAVLSSKPDIKSPTALQRLWRRLYARPFRSDVFETLEDAGVPVVDPEAWTTLFHDIVWDHHAILLAKVLAGRGLPLGNIPNEVRSRMPAEAVAALLPYGLPNPQGLRVLGGKRRRAVVEEMSIHFPHELAGIVGDYIAVPPERRADVEADILASLARRTRM